VTIAFDNSYARLPDRFFVRTAPTPVRAPKLIRLNRDLALHLGLDPEKLSSPEGIAMLSGSRVAQGSEPIAMAYAGHQFGHFQPQLGDGRALLLGEVIDRDGRRRDIQLKGSGPTAFSRQGDGRAALGPVLREYVVSEAMAALGVPTTRSLAAVFTGEDVERETFLPGGVLTRVAASHIRIGTFQFFAARGDLDGVRRLADHVIARHYPQARETESPYRALLNAVALAQAELVARWLNIGFIHGVLNTDNMSVAGETIDYGPCAFMDAYDPATVFSSIDRNGRYAFGNQPHIVQWNLARLAEALLPLLDSDEDRSVAVAQETLAAYVERFNDAYLAGLRAKFGFVTERDGDLALVQELLDAMKANGADFTLTFRRLSEAAADPAADEEIRSLFADPAAFSTWAIRWRARLAEEPQTPEERRAAMRAVNPMYIPRNHRIEAMIESAVSRGDYGAFEELLVVLAKPYEDQPEFRRYAEPPEPHERVLKTFCGT
jgi:uncharacterized protein YdiU (UPF0061 family)